MWIGLEAAPVVELGDRPHQAHVALLDQVQKRHPAALVLLGDRDDQPEVGLRHPEPRRLRSLLDRLGQLDLLLLGEQGAAADLAQIGAEGIGVGLARFGDGLGTFLELGQDVSERGAPLLRGSPFVVVRRVKPGGDR